MKEKLEELIGQIYGTGVMFHEAEREFRKRYILHVLNANKGNQCKAAREMGMHRNTLARCISEFGLVREFKTGFWMDANDAKRKPAGVYIGKPDSRLLG